MGTQSKGQVEAKRQPDGDSSRGERK